MNSFIINNNFLPFDSALAAKQYQQQRIAFWNQIAQQRSIHGAGSGAYHQRLKEMIAFHIAPRSRVIEIGCAEGDLLASVQPAVGVGIDFSEAMVERARQRHPELTFSCADGLEYSTDQKFDYVILSDLVNDVWDVQTLFERIHAYCHPGTRLILNFYSRVWTPALQLASLVGLKQKNLEQNWLTTEDVTHLLNLAGFEVIRHSSEVLFPLPVPGLKAFFNQFLVHLWPFNLLALTNLVIARPQPAPDANPHDIANPSVTVVVPARNESGNIINIINRLPQMGRFTELIFVEGNSTDDTYAEIERQMALHPDIDCQVFKQTGRGKGDAVRLGYQHARGDILMILDADLTVPPEYLPRFYDALAQNKGEFINGVRLVYPMEKEAMRLANFIGNKFFSVAFSWLLGQPVKDTLCGTKVLYKQDYLKIAANRSYFGDFDPFGDFDLLFGAAKMDFKIIDMPIRYKERVYGTTNIQRWKHGWLLLQMVAFAAFRLKFI
jgi:SAM-dependent methyltransferase